VAEAAAAVTPARRVHLAWLAFLVSAAILYGPVAVKLATAWWSDAEYSHGLLAAPLAIGIAVARRQTLRQLPRTPRPAGLMGAIAALGLLLLGILGVEPFLTRVSLLLFAASTVVYLYGWRPLRALALPFVLLALSIPIPAILMTRVTLPLQFAASTVAEGALGLLRIPVLRDGNVLVLSNATLQVAEACSGVRSLMSLLVVGVLIAAYAETRTMARWAIVAAAVPVTLMVNAFRVTLTACAAHRYGPGAARGAIHEGAGVLLFLVAVALLLACARLVAAARVVRRNAPRLELAS
jgi:exosortase